MSAANQIQYITHKQIDKVKWDNCIYDAPNGLIYAYSCYLDAMAEKWDALVLNDYETVMPLTWNSKYGLAYLYQPEFTASLGIFGKNLNEEVVSKFLKAIPGKFRLIEISLNSGNTFNNFPPGSYSRKNYVLNLNKSYPELKNAYRENHQRNINKAAQAGYSVQKNLPVNIVIQLNYDLLKTFSPVKEKAYRNFNDLYEILKNENMAELYGLVDNSNQLVASCVFFYSHKRAYYILVGNTQEGKNTGASHALIDAFIKENAGKDLVLDFEGSDIESLAFFYSGFGAEAELYPALRLNKLPWVIRWMKN